MNATGIGSQRSALGRSVEGRLLRSVCGMFVTGVTIVTSGNVARPSGLTVNSFTSVSLDPPLILVCIHKESRIRHVLSETGRFAVNFLGDHQESVSRAFASQRTALFQEVRHHSGTSGVPILSEALAFLECRVIEEIDGGDHSILLGEVLDLGELRRSNPLTFFRGTIGSLEQAS